MTGLSLGLASGGCAISTEAFPEELADLDNDGSNAGEDCNEVDAASYPGAEELCDGEDNDCDGEADEGLDIDGDLDGFSACPAEPAAADCSDSDPAVHPQQRELCDGVDQDCDGVIDNGFDGDGDGITSCAATPDCDDSSIDVAPDAHEICDGIDNNCDDEIDNGIESDPYESDLDVNQVHNLGVLETELSITASISSQTDVDTYSFTLSPTLEADWLVVRLEDIPTGTNYDLYVYDTSQALIGSSTLADNTSEQVLIPLTSSQAGAVEAEGGWLVEVRWAAGGYGCLAYSLLIQPYQNEST